MRALLLSTYELGRQPFGLASPAAWLQQQGVSVRVQDLSRQTLDRASVEASDLIGVYLPMHTATRLAVPLIRRIKKVHPQALICCYGLYAPLNRDLLLDLGVDVILGGEFEEGLRDLALRMLDRPGQPLAPPVAVSMNRQQFLVPERDQLPGPEHYAALTDGHGQVRHTGYTEASRGCLHLCRHCPIVPVYEGRFRVVQREVVLQDIERQVARGARHITFGDPDFFNGVGHSLAIVDALQRRHPGLSYDVTIKIEHLLEYRGHLPQLRETGCLLITSAVESLNNDVLRKLEKGHTREDFLEVVDLVRLHGLTLNPTFVTFTPWTTMEGYRDLLRTLADHGLVEQVAPIQLAIRLLVTSGSRLLELPSLNQTLGPFDPQSLAYPWNHPDPRVDELWHRVLRVVEGSGTRPQDRIETFFRIWDLAFEGQPSAALPEREVRPGRATVPYLNEPWYC